MNSADAHSQRFHHIYFNIFLFFIFLQMHLSPKGIRNSTIGMKFNGKYSSYSSEIIQPYGRDAINSSYSPTDPLSAIDILHIFTQAIKSKFAIFFIVLVLVLTQFVSCWIDWSIAKW